MSCADRGANPLANDLTWYCACCCAATSPGDSWGGRISMTRAPRAAAGGGRVDIMEPLTPPPSEREKCLWPHAGAAPNTHTVSIILTTSRAHPSRYYQNHCHDPSQQPHPKHAVSITRTTNQEISANMNSKSPLVSIYLRSQQSRNPCENECQIAPSIHRLFDHPKHDRTRVHRQRSQAKSGEHRHQNLHG